jgi:hypothetical protein
MATKAAAGAPIIEKLKGADPDGPSTGGVVAYWKFLFIGFLSGFMGLMIWLSTDQDRPAQWLSWGLVVVAVSSFATFYSKATDHDVRIRSAIAASVVITYLVFFALVVFSPSLQQASGSYKAPQEQQAKQAAEVSAATETKGNAKDSKATDSGGADSGGGNDAIPSDLFGSFTWVTATVVAFYFGGRSLEQIFKKPDSQAQRA